ncbi:MAG: sulfatase-like hydrolase/transferase [Planctomycetota bacterium]
MNTQQTQPDPEYQTRPLMRCLFDFLVLRSYSVIILAALFCTLAVKLYIALLFHRLSEYFTWILADLAVLLSMELFLSFMCTMVPRRSIVRIAMISAAIVCTWSVISAGWLIATGNQALPAVILPLIRDPLNHFPIVGHHLAKRPLTALALLGPSAIALTFFFASLAIAPLPKTNKKNLSLRFILSLLFILAAVCIKPSAAANTSAQVITQNLRYNCHLKAIESLFAGSSPAAAKLDLKNTSRLNPTFEHYRSSFKKISKNSPNIVIVILEGIQRRLTSLDPQAPDTTPQLARIAANGLDFTNVRPPVTHTTKALFALLTGNLPSVSQDIIEAVPLEKPYISLPAILTYCAGYRTAFFQSAKGSFEARPGLIHNLGYKKFWARDDLPNSEDYLGYLASDEFAMLQPIEQWIQQEKKPFLLTILCSVTHDPYEVPRSFESPALLPFDRYLQTIRYTDKFIAALDAALEKLNLTQNTILCVIGDHGEAFGEHDLFGHAMIPFEEALRVVWIIRAPALINTPRKINFPASSLDLTPTILHLAGFQIQNIPFHGIDILTTLPQHRKIYFAGWIPQGPAGYILDNLKFIYDPTVHKASFYDLSTDPNETNRKPLDPNQTTEIALELAEWRQASVLPEHLSQHSSKQLFDKWICRWSSRLAKAAYLNEQSLTTKD